MSLYTYRGESKEEDPNELITYRVVKVFTYLKRLMVVGETFRNVRHLKWTAFANKDLAVAIEDEQKERGNIMAKKKTFEDRIEDAKVFAGVDRITEAISTLKKADKNDPIKSKETKVPEWINELENKSKTKESKPKEEVVVKKIIIKKEERNKKDKEEIDFKVKRPFTMNNTLQQSGTIIKMPRCRKLDFSSHIEALEDIKDK